MILSVAADIMSENKGGHRILEIASELLNKKDIIFILVGAKKPKELNLPNVIFIEKTRNQIELAKLYTAADAYLISSKSENYPSTCLEALSCGTPVIGFDVGGVTETCSLGFGYFFEFGDSYNLVKSIKTLNFKELKSIQIDRIYKEIHSKFRMTKSYLDLYIKESN
jgi:glycosyltransferase involved in cell wall biosynthesis